MRNASLKNILAAMVVAVGAAEAFAQETRVIQPSPAYYQRQGTAPAAEVPEAQQPVYHAPRPAPAPVQPAVAPAPVQAPAAPGRPLPPHPRPGQPAGTMKPLPVQPRPVQPAAAQPAGTMKPLPVQPRPVQPGAAPAAPMKPLAVQPRPVQPGTQSAVQPAAAPVVAPAPVVQPRMVQPAVQPVAAPAPAPVPVQPRTIQPVAQPMPAPPRPVQPMAAPPVLQPVPVQPQDEVVFPAYYEPVYRDAPPSRLTLAPPPEPAPKAAEREGIHWFWGSKWPGLALGPKFGTTGIGADLTFGVTRYLNLRSGFNYATFGLNKKFGGVKYDSDLEMIGVPLLVDLYPAGGHFRLTGGVYIQPSMKVDLLATPGSPVQIGNHVYGPDVVGTLTGKIEADPLAPYLGIGFGNAVGEDQWLTFSLDIGVIFQTYDVSLTSDGAGMTAKLDTFREDMKKEEKNVQKDADNFKFYPVLTLGISYHF